MNTEELVQIMKIDSTSGKEVELANYIARTFKTPGSTLEIQEVGDGSVNLFFKSDTTPLTVPENAVVVAGSRPISSGFGREFSIHLYCPVIIKYRDSKTDNAIELEDLLR